MDEIILVDENDNAIGTMEKMEAHRKGVLHRAFSVILFNSRGEVLLQKRAKKKYHSGGLWTNTCCSHPSPDESTKDASRRRLMQEMGIDLQPEFAFKFVYKTDLDHDLVEHEYDHVFIGAFDGIPVINKDEVDEWKFMNLQSLRIDIEQSPEAYTEWFKLILSHPELSVIAA
ncbi:MAG: isopentenyl-diphosphate Delta-isomerase [Cyclobacteriaceae bacterium]|nr:isopentenyl-diphosphate Delta-isomerase [Cyclobacteriaceae bacterium]MDH4296254.1 isopentenyl-diphosphate Delta-isomerase [Cyclobacteriaceae bacterium]MDH5250657.1 isopentenyl-diphosphate Delta-isomerase [Cyclobacteriaceae bacterium]